MQCSNRGGGYFCFTLARANDDGITQETTPTEYWIDQITPETEFSGGTGTQTDPYKISSALELALLAKCTNEKVADTTNGGYYSDSKKFYRQTKDINLSGYQWTPIGVYVSYSDYSLAFSANYDGGNFEIQNLYINSAENYQGLFGCSYSNTISNIKLIDCNVSGKNYVAGISGSIKGRSAVRANFYGCIVSGNISCTDYCGGICGLVGYGDINSCENLANISSTRDAGGIAGCVSNDGSPNIFNCSNLGTITGQNMCGGIVGYASGGMTKLQTCINKGAISGNDSVGGIAGNVSCYVYDCTNYGQVTGTSVRVGGIAGEVYSNGGGEVNSCTNYGDVTGYYMVGGICGQLNMAGSGVKQPITLCKNYGTITGTCSSSSLTTDDYTGGILGYCGYFTSNQISFTLSLCINYGNVLSQATSGGICGGVNKSNFSFEIINCFSYGDVTGYAAAGAIIGYTGAHGENLDSSQVCKISNCVVDCTVKGKRTATCAGLIGVTRDNVTISACEVKMKIENATTVSEVNGIYGYKYADPTINACFVDLNGTKLYTTYDGENGWADYWTLIDGFNNGNLMAKGMFHIAQFGTATNEEIIRKLEEMGYAPFSPQTTE